MSTSDGPPTGSTTSFVSASASTQAPRPPQIITAPVVLAPQPSGTSEHLQPAHPGRTTSSGPPVGAGAGSEGNDAQPTGTSAPISVPRPSGSARATSTEDKDTLSPLAGHGLSAIPTRSTTASASASASGSLPSQAVSPTPAAGPSAARGPGPAVGAGMSPAGQAHTQTGSSSTDDRERGETGAGLKSWWKGFRERDSKSGDAAKGKAREALAQFTVFAVPLETSLSFASVQISTAGPKGSLYVWGYIPVVVAKCGLHLKETATEVQGTFRVSGSAKRMKELQAIFETPPKYGKNLDWKKVSFTSHDVATILRRYLTSMPEPIIPYELYHDFRNTLTQPNFSATETIKTYKALIAKMPKPNQYLLLYVLDLLSVFAKKSDKNLMTASNLAMIFQPGILSHPSHQLLPPEHALSARVLEFLIEHQDHFLLEMQLEPIKPKVATPSEASPTAQATSPPARARSPLPPTSSLRPPSASSGAAGSAPDRRPSSSASVRPPPPVRADTNFMIPSDSDEETPAGGYYINQGDPVNVIRSKTTASRPAGRRATNAGELPSTGLGIALAIRGGSPRVVSDNPSPTPSRYVVVDNPPLQPGGANLGRRRTAPTRRSKGEEEGFFARRRGRKASNAEAP